MELQQALYKIVNLYNKEIYFSHSLKALLLDLRVDKMYITQTLLFLETPSLIQIIQSAPVQPNEIECNRVIDCIKNDTGFDCVTISNVVDCIFFSIGLKNKQTQISTSIASSNTFTKTPASYCNQPSPTINQSSYPIYPYLGRPSNVTSRMRAFQTKHLPPTTHKLIRFGKYNWRVLEMNAGYMLIITENVINKMPSYSRYNDYVTWECCDLRLYLNTTFYDEFTSDEKLQIIPTLYLNNCNPWFGTGGGSETEDNIFLLSIEEVVSYFGDSGQLMYRNPNSQNCIDDQFNYMRRALLGYQCSALGNHRDGASSWWLRSPGGFYANHGYNRSSHACQAYIDAHGRIVVSGGRYSGFNMGARPVLRLKL